MSEQTQNNQQTIVIGLVVIAVLLAAILGVVIYKQMNPGIPAPTATAPTQTTPDQGGTQGAPPGMGTGGASTPTQATAFDPKTATKVPDGMTPEQMVKTYLDDVVAGKFEDAYKLLPIDTQKNYGDAKAYAEQVKAYGITSGETGKPVESGDTMTIVATQVTPQMPISYTWTFQKVDGKWYAAARAMGGQ